MKRAIIRVHTKPRRTGWWVTHGNLEILRRRQTEAVAKARNLALDHHSSGGLAQIVLHRADGTIKWERTYGADPKRHKG